jgi:hypothetical protein
MTDLDIMAEWLMTPSPNSRQRQQLAQLGVTREAIDRAGGLGWSRIWTTGRGYIPSNTGDVMLIQPVWASPAPSIYEAIERPLLADLIAWHPEEPECWQYRLCTPGAVLGADLLDLAHAAGRPISLHQTPLDWLRAHCRGAVLLEWCEGHWQTENEADKAEATVRWWGGEAA